MEQPALPQKPDCAPPKEPKCPEPKCPEPLPPPSSDPCAETLPARQTDPAYQHDKYTAGAEPAPARHMTPAQQLDALRNALVTGQREMLKFEPLKTSIADLMLRIKSLETAVADQPNASAAYTDFYRAVERYRSEIECGIPTQRCQLELNDKQIACIRKAIDTVDTRVRKALCERNEQDADVKARQLKQLQLDADLAWAKRWYDYFSKTMQARITRQRDDLKALSLLADPSKDQCEMWFYLSEMEAMLRSGRTPDNGTACYDEEINIATFLDCWPPKCYTAAYQHWIVAFNDAESAQKIGITELAEAVKHAADLAVIADEALAKRREWILKELKAQDCCGPMSKCP
ncbi:hypothetical protein BN2497_9585 [Janthinobacterium sp. CG23_2]|nr:hypothetical protein BN2497_9585 [Janthinobacterium sp. CG23_2]CUU31190.1 hypothetical protein BN3177_9585 [Janthinobacterium sp. CG23_2]